MQLDILITDFKLDFSLQVAHWVLADAQEARGGKLADVQEARGGKDGRRCRRMPTVPEDSVLYV